MKQIKIYEMWCDADASCCKWMGVCKDCEHCQIVTRKELHRDNGGDVTREIEVED